MRVLVLALALIVMPLAARAADATTPAPSLSELAPQPHAKPEPLSAGRKTAIALGALAGVIVTNVVTGGLITPVLGAGFFEVPAVAAAAAPAAASAAAVAQASVVAAEETYFASLGRIAVTAVGAVIGGEVGNWLTRE
jgi:hypothetical protein